MWPFREFSIFGHGKWKQTWKNGDVYDGDWQDGTRQGKGTWLLGSNFIYYIRCPWFLLERSMTTHLGRGSWKRSLVWFVIFFCGGVYAAFKSLTRLTFDQRSMTSLCSFHQQLSELISKAWITFDTLAAEFGINATKLLLWRSFCIRQFPSCRRRRRE